jgi:hypothetical protein
MANENLKKQMVVKLGTTTNTEAQLISNMVDGALSGKGGDDPELENLKKQMVIKLGTTTNEDAQIISNMVDNAAGGGGGGTDNTVKICKIKLVNGTSNTQYFDYTVISDNPLEVRLSIQDELLYYDTIVLQPNDEVTVDCLVSVGNLDSEHPENLYYYVVCGLAPVSNLYSEFNNVTLFDGVNPETQMHFLVPVITDITKPASFTYNV